MKGKLKTTIIGGGKFGFKYMSSVHVKDIDDTVSKILVIKKEDIASSLASIEKISKEVSESENKKSMLIIDDVNKLFDLDYPTEEIKLKQNEHPFSKFIGKKQRCQY